MEASRGQESAAAVVCSEKAVLLWLLGVGCTRGWLVADRFGQTEAKWSNPLQEKHRLRVSL